MCGSDLPRPAVGGVPCHFTSSQLEALLCPTVRFITLTDLFALLPACVARVSRLEPDIGHLDDNQIVCFTDGSYTPGRDGASSTLGWSCVFASKDPFCFSIVAGRVPAALIADHDVPSPSSQSAVRSLRLLG